MTNLGDLLIAGAGLGLGFSVIPAIVENFRTRRGYNRVTCVSTTFLLGVITIGMLFLGAVFAVVAGAFQTALWSILTFQAFVYGKAK